MIKSDFLLMAGMFVENKDTFENSDMISLSLDRSHMETTLLPHVLVKCRNE